MFLQTQCPTLTRCDDYDGRVYSSEVVKLLRSVRLLQSDASGSTTAPLPWPQPLASHTLPHVGRVQTRAAAGWQNIANAFIRGSQEYKIIAHLLPMILVSQASFLGAQESRSARWRKPRGTRASTSNFRISGLCLGRQRLLTKRSRPPSPGVPA